MTKQEPWEEYNVAWNHILEGRYQVAIAMFERFLPDTSSLPVWGNYGIALLLNGDPQAAEKAFRNVRELPNSRWVSNLKVGAALWYQGKQEEACADWLQQLVRIKTTKVRYDSASGLYLAALLWWASLRMDAPESTQAALSEIRLLRGWEDQAEEWGMTMTSFILGEITPDEFLLNAAGSLDLEGLALNIGQCRRTAQCFFYLAARYPSGSAGWRSDLESALRYGTSQAVTKPEYLIARYELSQCINENEAS